MTDHTGHYLKQAYQSLGQANLQWEAGAYASTVLKTIAEAREALREAENRLAAHAED